MGESHANAFAARFSETLLLRQGMVLRERGAQFRKRRVRIDPGFPDTISPGLDQRLGGLLP